MPSLVPQPVLFPSIGARPLPVWREALVTGALWSVALCVVGLFAWMLGDLILRGAHQLSFDFLFRPPVDAGRAGGISTILIGTLSLLGVALGSALPIGLGTALLLAEVTRSDTAFGRVVRRSLDVLAGVPSIVFGLFGLAFFRPVLGLGLVYLVRWYDAGVYDSPAVRPNHGREFSGGAAHTAARSCGLRFI